MLCAAGCPNVTGSGHSACRLCVPMAGRCKPHAVPSNSSLRGQLQTLMVDPPRFEEYAGRAAAKKWKASLRVDGIPGAQGMEVGKYLQEWLKVRCSD